MASEAFKRNQFKPGQSGNPGGRAHDKPFMRELSWLLKQNDWNRLKLIVQELVEAAEKGEPWAVQLVCERLDGKTPQDIRITREAREMSIDDILGELAEARAAAGAAGEDSGEGQSDQVH